MTEPTPLIDPTYHVWTEDGWVPPLLDEEPYTDTYVDVY